MPTHRELRFPDLIFLDEAEAPMHFQGGIERLRVSPDDLPQGHTRVSAVVKELAKGVIEP